jgi:NAD(P)-dependent dehydrogenase (short-subunit alcohol dehydrogenase family)
MSQTASTLASVMKEAWTSDRCQKQFEDAALPYQRIQKVPATMIGKQAQVPIIKNNGGGYTSFGAAGGAFNTASNVGTDQAVYTLITHGMPIGLELSALNQASGSQLQALIGSKDLEIEGAMSEIGKQAVRQLVTNGDSVIAACASGGASTTVSLVASPSGSSYGFDAIQRGWLHKDLVVDIGTLADTDTLATAAPITAFSEVASAPTITTATSVTTVAGTHFVFIANPNSATAANPETNGLRNIVNTAGALGGLNPSTAGQEFWSAAARDTTTTVFSLDLALSLQRSVMQKSGKNFTDVWTGLKQQSNFYSLLQNQVRFQGEMKMGAGDVGGVQWNNMKVDAYNDVLDSDWWCLTLSDFQFIHGAIDKPTWASDLEGSGGRTRWVQNSTQFVDALFFPFQIGVQRRNTQAGATALTA